MRDSLNIYFSVICAICCIALASCSKIDTGSNDMPYITFGVSSLDVDTKSIINSSDFIGNNPQKVYVYGVKNNTETLYNGVEITRQEGSNWAPPAAQLKQWERNNRYSFYGYTYSGTVSNFESNGKKITVTQPATYEPQNMVDYMLSHEYYVADGSNYHTVMLRMQHAMSCVDIKIKREEKTHNITLNSLTLKGIYNSATMECSSQATNNPSSSAGPNNVWKVTLLGGKNLTYSISDKTAEPDSYDIAQMMFLAIPQQLESSAELYVNYTVIESADVQKTYEHTFKLYNYSPIAWNSGHKINYTLTINTGVQLDAVISDWTDAGYIEGVIIPGIQSSALQ